MSMNPTKAVSASGNGGSPLATLWPMSSHVSCRCGNWAILQSSISGHEALDEAQPMGHAGGRYMINSAYRSPFGRHRSATHATGHQGLKRSIFTGRYQGYVGLDQGPCDPVQH